MEKTQLKALLLANFRPVAGIDFADTESATRNALIEFYGLKDLSPREIRIHKDEMFALIEEVLDIELPRALQERVGQFAEVKNFARDDEVMFKINKKGKRRAWLTIKKGSRGGIYQAARLDNAYMAMETWVETVGVFVTLEEIILGKESLVDLMNNILDGFVERMYVQVIEALQTAGSYSPAANATTASGFVQASIDPIIRIIAAYGSPMILGFRSVVDKINNIIAAPAYSTATAPNSDLDEIKAQGYVGKYKGTPVVVLPNYITNEVTNATWLLDESFLFILPGDVKPIKVALKGDFYITEDVHPTGSKEQNGHKQVGVSLLLSNNIGLYEDTTV